MQGLLYQARVGPSPAMASESDVLGLEKAISKHASNKPAPGQGRRFPKHLVDKYDVKFLLGHGGSSTVWRCIHRGTGKVRAVKKMDTTELPPREIAHEIALMRLLRNPNVVRCYDVFLEAQFVNIVIDIFAGGDLIDGFNLYRRSYSRLPDALLAHLSRQMVAAVSHMHSLKVIHRDIKGENFLCDRPDIGDPKCTIALADFGTAVRVSPGEQKVEQLGTPAFWAPEMWMRRYNSLVDVWAIGVTTYVLLMGRLPFEGEEDICKPVTDAAPPFAAPSYASEACIDFLSRCLAKSPKDRPTSAKLVKHSWLETPPDWRDAPQKRTDSATRTGRPTKTAKAKDPLDLLGDAVLGCFDGLAQWLENILEPKKAS